MKSVKELIYVKCMREHNNLFEYTKDEQPRDIFWLTIESLQSPTQFSASIEVAKPVQENCNFLQPF